ncbi:ribosome silencing factor [Anaeroselena agilis]|uniref:Ribosomal silencing factor RsfS n=1 Tax=Anaeroselena agilis TaxID=3063788 RepID=A0ABU3NZL1_9FIRM|nr:ribosome silencing factor [Selenomonadales bacterium 4137-cl]
MTEANLAELAAAAASDKKARDIVILDLEGVSLVADHFVICSANSTTQVQAIADNIEERLEEAGITLLRKEGYREARWILMDYGACVAHIFVEEDRRYYSLERLWGDAKSYSYQE